MRLYHYAPIRNDILKNGMGTFGGGYGNVAPYIDRAGSKNRVEITRWMESVFRGRSHAISVITERIKWSGNDPMLKEFVDNHVVFSFELEDLMRDEIIESVWCQEGSSLYPVLPTEIDTSPLSWKKCNKKDGVFFGAIRHYFIVLKDGILPPKYIRQEKINLY